MCNSNEPSLSGVIKPEPVNASHIVYQCTKYLYMNKTRKDYDLPEAITEWGWEYHHLGIPTKNKMPGERYLPQFKFYVSGFPTSHFGIEWMRFDDDSPMCELIKTVPHIAFVVKDLEHELSTRNFRILTPPNPPCDGVRVAMIEHNGAPIELIEFANSGN